MLFVADDDTVLELEDAATPAAYGIALEDPAGGLTKPLSFTVTK